MPTPRSSSSGISAWYLIRNRDTEMFKKAAKAMVVVGVIATAATMLIGHFNGQLMTREQPMKMAAAEALYNTAQAGRLLAVCRRSV